MKSNPTSAKVTNAFDTTGFEIFRPFQEAKKDSIAFITTWGLGHPLNMSQVVLPLIEKNVKVCLLVGYSKTTHSSSPLLQTLKDYKSIGWRVRALPSFHAKIWIINDKAWVGSANFVRGTITNIMVETPKTNVSDFLNLNWDQAYDISATTDLDLVPQAKQKYVSRSK